MTPNPNDQTPVRNLSETVEFFYKRPSLDVLHWLETSDIHSFMGDVKAQIFLLAARVTHDKSCPESDRVLFAQWRRYLYDVSKTATPADVDLIWAIFWATGNPEYSDMVLYISEVHPDVKVRTMCHMSYGDVSKRHGFAYNDSCC